MTQLKLNDPRTKWLGAIEHWRRGNGAVVEKLIREDCPRTPEAIEFLVGLANGTAKRHRGRPHACMYVKSPAFRAVMIQFHFQSLRESGLSKEDALQQCMTKFNVSESTASQAAYPRAKNPD